MTKTLATMCTFKRFLCFKLLQVQITKGKIIVTLMYKGNPGVVLGETAKA